MMLQVPPPPTLHAAEVNERLLQAWLPGEANCAGSVVLPTALRRPYLALTYPGPDVSAPVTYRFRLDASGRPLSIAREGQGYLPYGGDIAPSLAASRFAAGDERRDCRITYTARRTHYADTPLPDLVSYTLNPGQGQLPREGWAAIFLAAATCDDESRPAPLLQASPDFDKVAGTPGVRDWTMLAYDQDAHGAPVRIAVLTGTGNAALNMASKRALARSRYTGGARTGCRYPFWKAAATLPAPQGPDLASFRPAPATCPASVHWATQPPLIFPEPYRKRAIEGWAVIGFDVAPWGATGVVKALASEPSDEFGEAAVQLIRSSTTAASATGYTGCVERVRFVMGRPGSTPEAAMP